jgi:hypothetical protein
VLALLVLAAGALTWSLAPVRTGTNECFAPAVNYTIGGGTNPSAVAVGDLRRNGRLDLVVANAGAGTVSVLLASATTPGTFDPQVPYTVGTGPMAVVVADFNGDGRLDLAVANAGSSTVSVLLGNGNGTFQTAVPYTVGASPAGIAVGDFNKDGKLDLVVANSGGTTVSVLLGNGNGTFQPKADYSVGTAPAAVAVGDFNGDSWLDLAVANSGSGSVTVLPANPLAPGTFSTASRADYGVGASPNSIVAADLNRDGHLDLATANSGTGTVSVLLGNTTTPGVFQPALSFGAGAQPRGLVTADFNEDGALDLAVANGGTNNVSVLLGNPAAPGAFLAPAAYTVGTPPAALAVADLNRDGMVDLAVADGAAGGVSVLLGSAGDPGTFQPAVNFAAGPSPASAIVADFNKDGLPDIAVANNGSNHSTLAVMLQDPAHPGTFQTPVPYDAGVNPTMMAVADLNGDGMLDLVVADLTAPPGNVSVVLGRAAAPGQFHPRATYSLPNGANPSNASSVAVGDYNRDGRLDLAVADFGNDKVYVMLSDPNAPGTYPSPPVPYTVGLHPVALRAGDFDGDGNLDLAVVNFDGNSVTILMGRGNGTFQPYVTYSVGTAPLMVAVGDLNGDGKPDLVVANGSSLSVSVLLGNGDGTFPTPVSYPVGKGPHWVAIGDLNGDGKLDLVTANTNLQTDTVSVLLANGDGTFRPRTDYPVGHGPSSVAIADLNGDGRPDLVVSNALPPPGQTGDSTVSVLFNCSDPSATGGALTATAVARTATAFALTATAPTPTGTATPLVTPTRTPTPTGSGATLTASPPATTPGGTLTATWNGIPSPSASDWIGLYPAGTLDSLFVDWMYVSCSRTPGSPRPSGNCSFSLAPNLTPGAYEVRLFSNGALTRLATSNTVAVGVATATPATTATTPSCAPRPRVAVDSAPTGDGRLRVTITANSNPGPAAPNLLQSIQFTRLSNATIVIGSQTNVTGTYTLTPPAASLPFIVRPVASGQGVTAEFTVTDGCGAWPTFVGAGPSVLGGPPPAAPAAAITPAPTAPAR